MLNLFSTKSSEAGFRLHAFEVYNWGTFDDKIWSIAPEGETSLLTGANASGKTTLVDGLLTLLVPEKRMRFYNQTAGAKGERTEESYVLGEYGDAENQETQTRETRKLRPDKAKTHSVLLAVFQNENQFVTLVQCRWFSGSDLKRAFVLGYRKLTVEADFSPFDSNGDWKKRLRLRYPRQGSKEIIYFSDSPGEYGERMRKIFGFRSEQAHRLFSQTIGLKVLGNLDDFIRTQMLEKRDFDLEFQKIKQHYKILDDAHKAIEKAHQQIELLTPIRAKAQELTRLKIDLQQRETERTILPYYFAQKGIELLEIYIAEHEIHLQNSKYDVENLELEHAEWSNKERDLDMQIRNNEVGKQITNLENENRKLDQEKKKRINELNKYNKLATELKFIEQPDSEQIFEVQRQQTQERKIKTAEINEQLKEEYWQVRSKKEQLEGQLNTLSNELQVLRSQKNNITGRVAEIRQEILTHLNATEAEIPFVGELIKVKPEAQHWEPAIERLLHHFALQIIVPDIYYQKVNQFVNNNDLLGRIIYQRFKTGNYLNSLITIDDNKLYHKLAFKASPYQEWLENRMLTSYDYVCTDDLNIFKLANKALTSNGLIKNADRHEKDDTPGLKQRRQYVLGWDNKEKIATLREQAEQLDIEISVVARQQKHIQKRQEQVNKEHENLIKFLGFDQFDKMDWQTIAVKIQENEGQIQQLQSANDGIDTLKRQRENMLAEMKRLDNLMEDKRIIRRDLESELKTRRQELNESNKIVEENIAPAKETLQNFEMTWLQETTLTVENSAKKSNSIDNKLSQEIKTLQDNIWTCKNAAADLMRKFRIPDEAIVQQFPDWYADTHRLTENAEYIQDYVQLLDRIEEQELVEYKQQFKKYLNEEMITKMSDFKSWLDQHEMDIRESIDTLNISLAKINFKNNPDTFIKLHCENDYVPRIKDFKSQLTNWKPDLGEFQRTQDDRILEESFHKIKALLNELKEREEYRKEVLDVRNWLKFKAVEHFREDVKRTDRTYTSTSKLSGGESAQLTYTILGSAIAYQFNIHSEGLNTNSFRFICVDEAFSKQDDEKARFLMELCRQLHLQLMVVSPAKAEEVAIVEPYIAKVHFVQRKNNRHSVVYDLSVQQMQEQRQLYLAESNNVAS